MIHRLGWLTTVILFFVLLTPNTVHAGNTTCVGTQLDWYTSAVGESPCMTYQRLRQICDSQYEVPSFRATTPGDNCDTQLNTCCCNSISWALSMLCMNCQQDVIGGSPSGIDAGVGAYQMYLTNGVMCPSTNQSLPADIQTAVCNAGIKLDNFLYDLFWNTGAWYYVYTSETAQEDQIANNNNTFTHCPNATSTISPSVSATGHVSQSSQTSSAPTSQSPTISSTPTNLDAAKSSNMGAIVGGAVGGAVVLAALLAAAYFLRRRRRSGTHEPDAPAPPFGPPLTQTLYSSGPSIPFATSDSAPTVAGRSFMDQSSQILSSSGSNHNALSSDFSSYGSDQVPREVFAGPLRPNVLGSVPLGPVPLDSRYVPEEPRREDPFREESRGEEPQRAEPQREEDAGTLISFGTQSIPPPYNPAWDIFQRQNEKPHEQLAGSSTGPGSSDGR